MSVIQEPETGITRDRTFKSVGAGGTPAGALVSSVRPEVALWKHAIDEMLRWMSSPGHFEVDDRPDGAILETAIDYACDQIKDQEGAPAPASIVPSGTGRIAMEWNDGPTTVVIEFIALGQATYTRFKSGKIELKQHLQRNPRSRKLGLQG